MSTKSCARRLLLTIPALECGGAERVLTTLANYWVSLGWDITLLTYEKEGVQPFYTLDTRIRLIQIDALSFNPFLLLWDVIKRLFYIRKVVKKLQPDGVLSFLDMNNVLTFWAVRGLDAPVWVSERIDPHASPIPGIKKKLRDLTYNVAQGVVVQTQRIADAMKGISVQVISNPFMVIEAPELKREKIIVAAGRLDSQKGFDGLIRSFQGIASQYPDWSLVIWGEGEERVHLERMIAHYNLAKQVRLPGRTKDIFSEMQKGSIFVLSSRFEGMPNALGEAMSLGLAVISTDCPTGPRELIENEKNGLLVPVDDEASMAQAMEKLIQDEKLRESLGKEAHKAMRKYSIQEISKQWEEVFDGEEENK